MKRCPKCTKTYSDETLNFCLEDGEWLEAAEPNEEPATAIMPGASHPSGAPASPSADADNIKKRTITVVLLIGGLGLALIGLYLFRNSQTGPITQIDSIAVLPFQNTSGNPDAEYLSDGIAESLINNLTEFNQLKVTARGTAFRYKGKEIDPRTIGRELSVSAILTGSVRQAGDRLNIQVDLIDASSGAQLWGKEYERTVSDVLSIKQAIAREVVDKLKLRLSGEQQQQMTRRDPPNPEAYRLYLLGRYSWFKRTEKDLQRSIDYFQQAISLDPNYTVAYAGLADSYAGTGLLPSQNSSGRVERLVKAREAALKAVSLDGNSPEAHTSLGTVLVSADFDFTGGEGEYQRAIELNPNYAETRYWYAQMLSRLGRNNEAYREMDRALELDPMNLVYRANRGGMLAWGGRYDEAIEYLAQTRELDENFGPTLGNMFIAYQLKGDYDKAIEVRSREFDLNGNHQEAVMIQDAFAKTGWNGYLRYWVNNDHPGFTSDYIMAVCYASLGDKDKAFAALYRAFEVRESSLQRLKVDPRLSPLHEDPRFNELLKRVGFPD